MRKPMPLDVYFEQYNNNNLHEYDPYIIRNNILTIDEDWWNSLTLFTQEQIRSKVEKFKLGKIETPHEKLSYDNDDLYNIYEAYLDGFDYHRWYDPNIPNGPENVKMVPLNDQIKKELLVGNYPSFLKDILDEICDGTEYFMRLSSTSGKNEKAPRPMTTSKEILKHLVSVKLFQSREYERDKETYLVLIPWNNNINPRYEFRIFVVNNKLTAASPQRYWELHQHTSDELDAFEMALSDIKFIGHIPYKTFVADVYIDPDTSTCHLIELNPFGAHCGAGASFFNWIDDHEVLYGLKPAEMRYLSIINY